MTDREALLAAVLAAPDEDTPRLAFADWLGENGESERAEFVRGQCELARLPEPELLTIGRIAGLGQPLPGERCGGVCRACQKLHPAQCRYHELEDRGQRLLDESCGMWFAWYDCPRFRSMFAGACEYARRQQKLHRLDVLFSRGFASEIGCSADNWADHAKTILASHPIKKVALMTWPYYAASQYGRGGRAIRALRALWPGIKFVLPPA